ncbi:MAG TPA: SDR family oxidoreductase [Nitrospirae bacterium]|nr:gluconate 5-dehydrogenase [bacterium BMS3Abin06]HDH11401.1 SDR family oxidoreductase [Nitrospirota bacterium]HDZ01445.1 SDR family oxidoreductase [Nitrospirota bacterium]
MGKVQFGLEDKGVLITGASKGLGAVCAGALSEEGARLVLMARSGDRLEEVRKNCRDRDRHLSIALDLCDMQALESAVKKAEEFLGDIDVVLHVAGGGLGMRDPLLSADEFFKLFSLNVAASVQINKMVAPKMMERKQGNLVHVCSISSSEATGSVGYNTVKAALAAYVRSLGREIAGSGVVATGILPGGFYAPENAFARLKERNPEGFKDFVERRLPRKVIGRAEELVPMILLLSSEAASMMGGCLVPIDAGEGLNFITS